MPNEGMLVFLCQAEDKDLQVASEGSQSLAEARISYSLAVFNSS